MQLNDKVLRRSYSASQKITPGIIQRFFADGTAEVLWLDAFKHISAGWIDWTSTIKLTSLEPFSEEALAAKKQRRKDKRYKDSLKLLKSFAHATDWILVGNSFLGNLQTLGWIEVEYYIKNGRECGRHQFRLTDLGKSVLVD